MTFKCGMDFLLQGGLISEIRSGYTKSLTQKLWYRYLPHAIQIQNVILAQLPGFARALQFYLKLLIVVDI